MISDKNEMGEKKDSGDCTTVATQPEATTLQQFIKNGFEEG